MELYRSCSGSNQDKISEIITSSNVGFMGKDKGLLASVSDISTDSGFFSLIPAIFLSMSNLRPTK
jgi:hypothetical protein